MTIGMDIHPFYQRTIDWDRVANESDIKFVLLKVSDGGSAYTRNDSGIIYRPDTHANGAHSVGIPIGGYHYAQMSPSATKQADVLIREIIRLKLFGLPPMLDLEAPFVPGQISHSFASEFLHRIRELGYRPGIYGSTTMLGSIIDKEILGYDPVIWVARYPHNPGDYKNIYYKGPAHIHQFENHGHRPGIIQDTDLDYLLDESIIQGAEVPLTDDEIKRIAERVADAVWSRAMAEIIHDNKDSIPASTALRAARADALNADINSKEILAIVQDLNTAWQALINTGVSYEIIPSGEIVLKAQKQVEG